MPDYPGYREPGLNRRLAPSAANHHQKAVLAPPLESQPYLRHDLHIIGCFMTERAVLLIFDPQGQTIIAGYERVRQLSLIINDGHLFIAVPRIDGKSEIQRGFKIDRRPVLWAEPPAVAQT